MFRRRKPLSFFNQMRSLVWPERGFKRLFSYLGQRIIRLPGTPYSIACGIACGVFASFTPFLGLHFLIAAALAVILRGNVLASALGTFFGNPWTFIPIWLVSYDLGYFTLSKFRLASVSHHLNIDELISIMGDLARFLAFSDKVSWGDLEAGLEVMLFPLVIGGVILGTVAWFLFFFLTYQSVTVWRRHRAKRLSAKAACAARGHAEATSFSSGSAVKPNNDEAVR